MGNKRYGQIFDRLLQVYSAVVTTYGVYLAWSSVHSSEPAVARGGIVNWIPHWLNAPVALIATGILLTIVNYVLHRRGARVIPEPPVSGTSLPMPKVRTAEEWTALAATLEQRINQKFEYCELILDSKNFINCTFTHVSLFYDGIAPTTFSNCEFDDDTVKHFHTHNPGIAQWMETARSLGLLKPGAKYAITPLPSESAKVEALGNQLRNQQWRQISSEQKQQFQDALRGEHPEIWRVYCVKANLEAQNYSMQLMKMFRDCGIMINEIPDKDEDRSEFDRHRLVVLVKNVDSLAPNALTLTKALDAANIAYYLTQANVGRTAPDTYFALRIGPKAKPLRP